ncbi:hypothetical protein FNH22_14350 [Fulvivirga sp. M361]|uniref:hypothetical protein n=1 Tax=Fulvivirga sp. M361 TaxID=2594266 RepID=UPI00117AE695|nr:hypothetical protein [Fulvivirga sp. M361]TRX58237.1 hypothetical protein FNH22_14350 [Fulvivirga sp. M361]
MTDTTLTFHEKENKYDFKLVEGMFSAKDAGKVLKALIKDKINYHSFEMFCIQEKNSGDVSHSRQRIVELKNVNDSLKELLATLGEQGAQLKINGTIEIEVIK